MSAKNETPAGYICKGAWVLGSACGECARCLESLPEFLAEDGMPARRARAIIAADRALRPGAVAGDATMPVVAEIRNKTQELGTWVHWVARRFSGDKLVKQADALAVLAAKDAEIARLTAALDATAKLVDSLNAQLAESWAPAAWSKIERLCSEIGPNHNSWYESVWRAAEKFHGIGEKS